MYEFTSSITGSSSKGIQSFRSQHYPKNRNALAVIQETAMRYYAGFTLVVMVGVMVKVYVGEPVLAFGLIGAAIALALGNAVAYVQLRKNIAQIFFVKEHISLISVYEILYKKENSAFPIRYTNASRSGDVITFHYHDQFIQLKKEDWEDFELIWTYLTQEGAL